MPWIWLGRRGESFTSVSRRHNEEVRIQVIAVGTWNTYSHVIVIAEIKDVQDDDSGSPADVRVTNPWFGCDEREDETSSGSTAGWATGKA